MKKQNLPQQTHFIGVLTPEDITLTLEDCRRYMNEAYGCRSGHLTPIVEKDDKWTSLRDAAVSLEI